MNDFFNIEGKQLDKEQIESACYIGNQLVIAGAGAGKTLSIVGKVKYLLEKEKVKPSEILLLAFTDKVVNELKERVSKVSSKFIDILTFHKLGLKIFNRSDNHMEISTEEFYKFIYNLFYSGEYEVDNMFASAVYHFINSNYNCYDMVDESTLKKFTSNINGYTLKGDKTNSVAAIVACNMLFVNDIEYDYIVESKYSHYIRINDNIIHFTKLTNSLDLSLKGIDYTNVPIYIYKYLNKIGYKINNYESYKNYLENPYMVKKFSEFFTALEEAQKVSCAADVYDGDFDYLIENYCNNKPQEIMFLNIFRQVRKKFCQWLKDRYKTDFDYMIYGPIEILRNNKFLPYKYIIVDEYQDISPARYNLLVEMLKQNDGYLMAYGDDWQSIYSFSGSNNKFFMEFQKEISDSKEFYLKNTYRNSQQLIEASSKFVMLNPCQKEKNIKSNKSLNIPIQVIQYSHSNVDSLIYTLEYISKIEGTNTVSLMILGRTNYSIDIIKQLPEVTYLKTDDCGRELYVFKKYENIIIQFLTIHRSKGLEADYVFVTGVNCKDMPLETNSKIPYISIINKLNEYEEEKEHEKYEGLPNSEERRLFYVALTRSKNIVFLSTPKLDKIKPSIFIDDLKKNSIDKLTFVNIPKFYQFTNFNICPTCGGMISSASKTGRIFYFCENKCHLKGNNGCVDNEKPQNVKEFIYGENDNKEARFKIGKKVKHFKYGKGKVINIVDDYLYVKFEKNEQVIKVKVNK